MFASINGPSSLREDELTTKAKAKVKPSDAAQASAVAQSAVRFYPALDPNNPAAWEHDNSEIVDFESCNSLGVDENLARDFPELLPDFVFIGDQIAAREQFLQDLYSDN